MQTPWTPVPILMYHAVEDGLDAVLHDGGLDPSAVDILEVAVNRRGGGGQLDGASRLEG